MNSKNSNLIILVIAGIFIFVIGSSLGFFYKIKTSMPNASVDTTNLIGQLSLKTVPTILAFGQVSKIQGRNITLSFNGDTMTVPVGDSAQVRSANSSTNAQQNAQFGDVKVGQTININLKVLSDGSLEGISVFIMP